MEYDDLKAILKVMDKSESEKTNSSNYYEGTEWSLIPENVLVRIFKYLCAPDILNCGLVCRRWNNLSYDSLLWKFKFQQDFKIQNNIPRKPGEVT